MAGGGEPQRAALWKPGHEAAAGRDVAGRTDKQKQGNGDRSPEGRGQWVCGDGTKIQATGGLKGAEGWQLQSHAREGRVSVGSPGKVLKCLHTEGKGPLEREALRWQRGCGGRNVLEKVRESTHKSRSRPVTRAETLPQNCPQRSAESHL